MAPFGFLPSSLSYPFSAASWGPCSPCHGSSMQWLEMGSYSNLWPKLVAVSAQWWQHWYLEEWQVGERLGYPLTLSRAWWMSSFSRTTETP